MRSLKIPNLLNRIFSVVFIAVFSTLLILILAKGYVNESDSNTYNCSINQRFCIFIAFLMFVLSAMIVYLTFNRICNRSRLIRTVDKDLYVPLIILTACAFMFIFQLAVGYLLACEPVTDVKILNVFSADFAKDGDFSLIKTDFMDYYMVRYQNNLLILFILSLIYRISYLLTGAVSVYLPIFINALAINISVILTVFLSRKLFGNRVAFIVLFLCLLFAPYYTYVSYYYTDSLSMPFAVGSLYLFVYAFNSKSLVKELSLLALCGALLYFSFKLKGSGIIIIAALALYLLLKLDFKRAAVIAAALLIGIALLSNFYTTKINENRVITPELSERYEYPYTHWVMIGLKGYGNYNQRDSDFTRQYSSKELKTSANIAKIKSRINKYGLKGLVKHLAKKAVWTWEDGTYYISHHIENPIHQNILHDYALNSGKKHFVFYGYSCAFQLFMILMMIFSAYKGLKNPKLNFTTLLRIIVFGAFIFFLVWETRSRYLYNLTPIFIILSAEGMDAFPLRGRWANRLRFGRMRCSISSKTCFG